MCGILATIAAVLLDRSEAFDLLTTGFRYAVIWFAVFTIGLSAWASVLGLSVLLDRHRKRVAARNKADKEGILEDLRTFRDFLLARDDHVEHFNEESLELARAMAKGFRASNRLYARRVLSLGMQTFRADPKTGKLQPVDGRAAYATRLIAELEVRQDHHRYLMLETQGKYIRPTKLYLLKARSRAVMNVIEDYFPPYWWVRSVILWTVWKPARHLLVKIRDVVLRIQAHRDVQRKLPAETSITGPVTRIETQVRSVLYEDGQESRLGPDGLVRLDLQSVLRLEGARTTHRDCVCPRENTPA